MLFGSTASQFLLNSTVSHHLSKSQNPYAFAIQRNLYVDNLHNSTFETEKEMLNFYFNCVTAMKTAGFLLKGWCSNSEKLNSLCNVHQCLASSVNNVNVLGLRWLPNTDQLKFSDVSVSHGEITKRRYGC